MITMYAQVMWYKNRGHTENPYCFLSEIITNKCFFHSESCFMQNKGFLAYLTHSHILFLDKTTFYS